MLLLGESSLSSCYMWRHAFQLTLVKAKVLSTPFFSLSEATEFKNQESARPNSTRKSQVAKAEAVRNDPSFPVACQAISIAQLFMSSSRCVEFYSAGCDKPLVAINS